MNQNPSLQIGIDGSMDPRGSDPRDQNLSNRRISAVRDALIQAGVPSYTVDMLEAGIIDPTKVTHHRSVDRRHAGGKNVGDSEQRHVLSGAPRYRSTKPMRAGRRPHREIKEAPAA